jgi:GNAT superfamily N-acetyltransferase
MMNYSSHTRDVSHRYLERMAASLSASRHGLHVEWFDHWHPALDEALESLPEKASCPHELFRLLVQTPGSTPKRATLVTEHGVPVAVAGLRQRGWCSWEPVTQWIVPGAVFPAQPGYLIPVLEALGVDVWVAWWRMESPPPPSRWTRYMASTPTHRIRCSDDFERYWRENKYFKTIQNKRNRCRDFILAVNSPGSAEWTITNWEANWRTNPTNVDPSLPDRIVAARYLEKQGRYYTLSLLDQGTPIGGATMTVHHNDLVAGVIYREPEYDWYGIGVRLIDACISFAAESGFETIDLGGGHDYKKYWAPQEGKHWLLNICPEPLFRAKQVVNWARRMRGKVTELTQPSKA